jgi:hypothetical protein
MNADFNAAQRLKYSAAGVFSAFCGALAWSIPDVFCGRLQSFQRPYGVDDSIRLAPVVLNKVRAISRMSRGLIFLKW